mmetsp:Transcript_146034/g.468321  ORF Transcript_146034/g.468321 Transcript_146034/m.468321 type:complete len:214 (-) Transcript_146034:272-913(-)
MSDNSPMASAMRPALAFSPVTLFITSSTSGRLARVSSYKSCRDRLMVTKAVCRTLVAAILIGSLASWAFWIAFLISPEFSVSLPLISLMVSPALKSEGFLLTFMTVLPSMSMPKASPGGTSITTSSWEVEPMTFSSAVPAAMMPASPGIFSNSFQRPRSPLRASAAAATSSLPIAMRAAAGWGFEESTQSAARAGTAEIAPRRDRDLLSSDTS